MQKTIIDWTGFVYETRHKQCMETEYLRRIKIVEFYSAQLVE